MKTRLLLFICLLVSLGLNAQRQEVSVSAGDTLSSMITGGQYAFEEFTDGTVLFKKGNVSRAKLNYSYLLGELQFIDPTGKIMAIANPQEVNLVTIGNRRFVNKAGSEFMELLVNGDISLCVARKGAVTKLGKSGVGYGSSTSASSTVKSLELLDYETLNDTKAIDNVVVSLDNTYFLLSSGKKTPIKGLKTYLKALPNDKSSFVEKYVEDNKVNFKKESDLIKLTEYCNQL